MVVAEHAPSEPRTRFPLALKLGLALTAVAVATGVLLLVWIGPYVSETFAQRSAVLIERSSEAMRAQATDAADETGAVLSELITHTTDARSRMLADLPLALYAGDVEALRRAVRERDEARGERLQANAGLLREEMGRRSDRRIEREVGELIAEQRELASAFAADLRNAYLGLATLVLLALVLLLGLGLHSLVVRPLRRLQEGTRAVARGDLEVRVEDRIAGSRDEVGALATDFAAMVAELRQAREQLRRQNEELAGFNESLEREVRRKTEHLEAAQEQLVQAARLASVGTLAGGIAHEFGNLIAGIRGCAVEALRDTTDPEQREPLEVIQRAADRAGVMTEDLLRFARQKVVPRGTVDVAEVAAEALGLLEPHARRLGVEVVRETEGDCEVDGDPAALHQVFVNLGTNALQAMPRGGRLSIAVRRVGSEVVATVADTGAGIAAEHLERIFDPFFTTKDREVEAFARGTGLGLSVTYGAVEAHGGRIEVASEVGEGTVFTVVLPARSSQAGAPAQGGPVPDGTAAGGIENADE